LIVPYFVLLSLTITHTPQVVVVDHICLSVEIEGCVGITAGTRMNGVYTPFVGDCGDTDANASAAYYSAEADNYIYLRDEAESLWEGERRNERCQWGAERSEWRAVRSEAELL